MPNHVFLKQSQNNMSTADMCAQRIIRSVCAFEQSDQNNHCAFWIAKDAKFHHVDIM